jgi:hypothetical protein
MATEAVKLGDDLRAFLRECAGCQRLSIAAWAARILRANQMSMAALERCLALGFEF